MGRYFVSFAHQPDAPAIEARLEGIRYDRSAFSAPANLTRKIGRFRAGCDSEYGQVMMAGAGSTSMTREKSAIDPELFVAGFVLLSCRAAAFTETQQGLYAQPS